MYPKWYVYYNGGAKICSPEGFTIARAIDYSEGYAIGEFDPELMAEWRNVIIPRIIAAAPSGYLFRNTECMNGRADLMKRLIIKQENCVNCGACAMVCSKWHYGVRQDEIQHPFAVAGRKF